MQSWNKLSAVAWHLICNHAEQPNTFLSYCIIAILFALFVIVLEFSSCGMLFRSGEGAGHVLRPRLL